MLCSVQLFVMEQWCMGVCVCVLDHVRLHQRSGIRVCVCVRVQLCLNHFAGAVAYGSMHVCVCVCV